MPNFNLGTASGQIVVDGSGAAAGFNVAQSAAQGFLNAIESRVQAVRDLGDRLTRIGATGVAGFGVAVHAASKFEQQMSFVEAVSGATTDEMERLRQKALELGKSTAYSATEAGGAMEELIKAGLSVEEVLNGAADATVSLAAAGGVELKEAATIAANAMNQFNLEASEMPKIADLIAGAANASAIDVTDFGFSLSQAGAVANLTGLKFEDLAVAIAEMGNAGIKGSDAGTSLKTFLTNLIPVTEQQTGKFEELGLVTVGNTKALENLRDKGIKPVSNSYRDVKDALEKYVEEQGGAKVGTEKNKKAAMELGQELGGLQNAFFKANGEAKSMRDIQEVLQNATKDLTKEQKLATLEVLFGSDAIRAAAVLAGEGAEGYDKMADAMGKVKAADVARIRLNNLSGAVEEMKGAFETARITIGTIFLPIIRKVVEWITKLINIFNDLPPGVQKAIAIFFAVGTVMSLVVGIAIKMAFILGPLLAKWLGFKALGLIFSIFRAGWVVLAAGGGVMAALSASAARAAVVMGRFWRAIQLSILWGRRFIAMSRAMAAAWAFITGPIGIAIGIIIAAGIILYNTFEPFKELIDAIWKTIKGAFRSAMEQARKAVDQVVESFKEGKVEGEGIRKIFSAIGVAARFVWEKLVELKDIFVKHVIPAFKEAYRVVKEQVEKSFGDIWRVIQEDLVPAFQELFKSLDEDVVPVLKDLWEALEPVVKTMGKLTLMLVGGLLVAFFEVQKFIYKYVVPALLWLWSHVLKYVVVALEWLIKVIIRVIEKVVEWGNKVAEVAGKIWRWFKENILPVLEDVYNYLIDNLIKAWNYFVDALNEDVIPALKEVWKWFSKLKDEVMQKISDLINNYVLPAWRELRREFDEHVMPTLRDLWAWLDEHIMPVLEEMWKVFEEHVLPQLKEWGKWLLIAAAVILFIVPIIIILGTILSLYIAGFIIKYVLPALKEFVGYIGTKFKEAVDRVVGFAVKISEGLDRIRQGADWLAQKMSESINRIVTAFDWFLQKTEWIRDMISRAWDWLYNYLVGNSVIPDLVNEIIRWFGRLASLLNINTSGIVNWMRTKWDTFRQFMSDIWTRIRTFVVQKANEVGSGLRAAFTSLPGWAQGVFVRLKDAAQGQLQRLITFMTGLPGRIRSAFGNPGSLLYSIGQAIMRGLISGISSLISTLTSKLNFITSLIPEEKGPLNKDKVLLENSGKVIMEGLIRGITGEEGALIEALRGLTQAIPGAALGAYSAVPSSLSRAPIERRLATAPAAGASVVTNIYNPVAEKASDSVASRMRTLSAAGVI